MEKKIAMIGGDLRNVHLAKLLVEDGWKVHTFGLEKAKELQDLQAIVPCETIEKVVKKTNIVIGGIPLSTDGIYVNMPYSDSQMMLQELYDNLKGKKLFAGRLEENDLTEKVEVYDLIEREDFAILNAIATAEGAIQIAMEETTKTVFGSNILVMGFGKIGKMAASMLKGIGANVYCGARRNVDLTYVKAFGYCPVPLKNLEENLSQFDIIINTIPVEVLNKSKLDVVKKDVLIIDLASKPGGVNFDYAKEKNIKTIWALGLPGKVAPASAATYMKETIDHILDQT